MTFTAEPSRHKVGAARPASVYPEAWEADALLADGSGIQLRPIRASDADLLAAMHGRLSAETIRSRYFGAHPHLEEAELRHLVEVDYHDRMAMVAVRAGALCGVARYDREEQPENAEVAFVVLDALQGQGVGTLLLEHLAAYARLEHVDRLIARTLPSNVAMVRLLETSGLELAVHHRDDLLQVDISTEATPAYLLQRDERERRSAARSVAKILRPQTVAVVGAGRRQEGVGHTIVRNLVLGEFTGAVYPINPHARSICGVPAYGQLAAVPDPVDVAVIAVPADAVLSAAADAAAAGVSALVVVSSGFAELGEQGEVLQRRLLDLARANGMRVVGPNCLGVANTAPDICLNATFSPCAPTPGNIALLSQSGAVGISLLEEAARHGLGVSGFVSVGNKLDVSSNDLLCFWEDDEATGVIALYLESFGNPRKFARIAHRVARKKPIVALKAGRTAAGARGAVSHTAAAATPQVAVKTLLSTCGVVEVERLEDLVDTVAVLASQPLARGQRVALVGNSGGPLILAADACAEAGLVVEELDSALQAQLAAVLPPASACGNPIDMTAEGDREILAKTLQLVVQHPKVDAVVAVVTSLVALSLEDARAALERAGHEKPLVACLLGSPAEGTGHLNGAEAHTPYRSVAYVASPERAVAALGRACAYARWREGDEPVEQAPALFSARRAQSVVAEALRRHPNGGWLQPPEAAELLEVCGIGLVASATVASASEAAEAAIELGFPVVVKAASGDLVHKSDVGGVVLGLESAAEVHAAYVTMHQRLGDAMGGAIVQRQLRGGVETIVGLSVDPSFGPLLMFGIGGTATDLLRDHAFAVPPVSARAARELLTSIRAAALLTGYRNSIPVNLDALGEVLRRVGELALACPEVVELDLNPVLARAESAIVLDAKIRVEPRALGPEPTMRLLRKVGGARAEAAMRQPTLDGPGKG